MTEADRCQVDMIHAYLSDCWCPARPPWCYEGPVVPVLIQAYRPATRWVRHLEDGTWRVQPYSTLRKRIRAA